MALRFSVYLSGSAGQYICFASTVHISRCSRGISTWAFDWVLRRPMTRRGLLISKHIPAHGPLCTIKTLFVNTAVGASASDAGGWAPCSAGSDPWAEGHEPPGRYFIQEHECFCQESCSCVCLMRVYGNSAGENMSPSWHMVIISQRYTGLCCKNSRGNTIGVKPRFLLSLGCHSKQAGDERDLPHDVPFFHTTHLPFPHHIHDLISL